MNQLLCAASMLPGIYTIYKFNNIPYLTLCYSFFTMSSINYHIALAIKGRQTNAINELKLDLMGQMLLATCISNMCNELKAHIMLACVALVAGSNLQEKHIRVFSIGLSGICIATTIGFRPYLLGYMIVAFIFYFLEKTKQGAKFHCHSIFHLICNLGIYETIKANIKEL